MTATMRWYNPTRRVEEEIPSPMSEAQAIEMLSGHSDSDRFIEVYRQMRGRNPDIVQALIFTGETFYMEHGQGKLAEQHRKKELTSAGKELLEHIERMADTSEPLSEEILVRVSALPPSDQAELVSILGGKLARGDEGHRRKVDLARSAAETIREAEEQELAAGRPVKPHMTLREALEILGR